MVIDTETANSLDDPLVYDVGFLIADRKGKIYAQRSYVVNDIFSHERELMQSAYYAQKIPLYHTLLEHNVMEEKSLFFIQAEIKRLCQEYNVKYIYAYNMSFDRKSTSTSLRYISKSEKRWFFPYGVKLRCIWAGACDTIFQQKTFKDMAITNGWYSPSKNYRTNAEVGFQYITGNLQFVESHTALSDALVELQILVSIFRQKKKVDWTPRQSCWQKVGKVAV